MKYAVSKILHPEACVNPNDAPGMVENHCRRLLEELVCLVHKKYEVKKGVSVQIRFVIEEFDNDKRHTE